MNVFLAGNHLSAQGRGRAPIEDLAVRLSRKGYRCICASSFLNGIIRGAHLAATALIRQADYEIAVVDLYSGRAFLWGDALSRILSRLKKPFILVLHGGNLPEFATRHPAAVRACLARASRVVAPSQYLIESLRAYCGDIRHIPNPVDLNGLAYRWRRSATPSLVWVRAFHRIYNPVLAPRMMKDLLERLPHARLTMIGADKGDGSYQETVQEARRLKVDHSIHFAGLQRHEQVFRFLQHADVFVSTTNYDNTPVSVLEAMACGLCVVSTAVGGVPWLIQDRCNGLLVPPNDPTAMAEAVAQIVNSPELTARLSSEAVQTALHSHWDRVLPQWEQLLDEVMRTSSGQEPRYAVPAAR